MLPLVRTLIVEALVNHGDGAPGKPASTSMGPEVQISALPLGARIKLDPWNDKVEMVRNKPVALISEREKMPLGLTPFLPYLTYYSASGTVQTSERADAKAQPEAAQPQAADPQPQPQTQPQPQD